MQAALELGELAAEQPGAGTVAVKPGLSGRVGQLRRPPVGHRGRARAVRDDRGHLQRGPQPGRAGHLDRVHAQAQHLTRVGRHERGHREVSQRELGGARHGRGLCRGIVPDDRHRPAARIAADQVRVPQGVGRPVESRRLPVPVSGHAVVAQLANMSRELRAGHRGRRELLVQGRPVLDAMLGEQRSAPSQFQVVAGQRRALVPRDERRRRRAAPLVITGAVEHQADESLDPGEIDGSVEPGVAIFQAEAGGCRCGGGGGCAHVVASRLRW